MARDEITREHCTSRAKAFGETNDCTVRACAVAMQKSYDEVHALMAAAGRRPRRGMFTHEYHRVLAEQGYRVEKVAFRSGTPRTIEREFRTGTYLVNIRRHVMCLRDGMIHDWAAGRLHRVRAVYRVTKVGAPQPEAPAAYEPPAVRDRAAILAENLKAREALQNPITVKELAERLGGVTEKQARGAIDRLRRQGYPIKNVAPGTFQLVQG